MPAIARKRETVRLLLLPHPLLLNSLSRLVHPPQSGLQSQRLPFAPRPPLSAFMFQLLFFFVCSGFSCSLCVEEHGVRAATGTVALGSSTTAQSWGFVLLIARMKIYQ